MKNLRKCLVCSKKSILNYEGECESCEKKREKRELRKRTRLLKKRDIQDFT